MIQGLSEKQIQQYNQAQRLKQHIRKFNLNFQSHFVPASVRGLCGLSNLGNTCYMNSALQCLTHCSELTEYFLSNKFSTHINTENVLGSKGWLAASYSELVKSMWHGTKDYVSPSDFKKCIGHFASAFSGYQQQDAQEFLSFLIDGLHEDLKRPIEEDQHFPFSNSQDEQQQQFKQDDSFLKRLFYGQFKSTMTCPFCQKISIQYENYNMMQLPIPNKDNIRKFYAYFIDTPESLIDNNFHKYAQKIALILPLHALVEEIEAQVMAQYVGNKKQLYNLEMYLVDCRNQFQILEKVSSEKNIQYIVAHDGTLFIYYVLKQFQQQAQNVQNLSKTNYSMQIQIQTCTFEINTVSHCTNDKAISYPRIFNIDSATLLTDIHHYIYNLFRSYLQKYFLIHPMHRNSEIQIDPTNCLSLFEFEQLQLSQCVDPMYKVYIQRDVNTPCPICKQTEAYSCCQLPTTNDKAGFKYINEIFGGKAYKVNILIVFNGMYTVDDLNLSQAYLAKQQQQLSISNLNLNTNKQQQQQITLADCLQQFTRKEKLDQDNQWYCSECKQHIEGMKRLEIRMVPKYLIFHLKRFKSQSHQIWNKKGKQQHNSDNWKLEMKIEFPYQLDMSPYVLQQIQQQTETGIDSKKLYGSLSQKQDNINYNYSLVAVTNHFGTLSGGHYTACAFDEQSNQWYNFNDSTVSKTHELDKEAAYLLFYKRNDNYNYNQ